MKCFTIHSVCEDLFSMDLSDYILTFDDCLYSQYFYWNWINKVFRNNKKILFVPTDFIIISDYMRKQFNSEFIKFPDCFESLELWKQYQKNSNYMTLGELKHIIENYDVTIGGHGHKHYYPFQYGLSLVDKIIGMKQDVKQMFEWFEEHLSIRPTKFCYPFNKHDTYLQKILEQEGVTDFYGSEREEIEDLCKNQ